MSSVQADEHWLLALEAKSVVVGAVSGVFGGIAMGLLLQFGTDLIPLLGAFIGRVSVLRGWLVHLSISVIYGVMFAVIVAYPPVQSYLSSFDSLEYVLVGITYAVMIAAVSIGILPFVFDLPWETAVSEDPLQGVPDPTFGGLLPSAMFAIGHVVYGGILGGVYAQIGPRGEE